MKLEIYDLITPHKADPWHPRRRHLKRSAQHLVLLKDVKWIILDSTVVCRFVHIYFAGEAVVLIWPWYCIVCINTLRSKQIARHFVKDIIKCISWRKILNKISLKCALYSLVFGLKNMSAWVQIMAWRRAGENPLSEAFFLSFTDAYMRHSALMS